MLPIHNIQGAAQAAGSTTEVGASPAEMAKIESTWANYGAQVTSIDQKFVSKQATTVTMTDLLVLLAQIMESAREVRVQTSYNRIALASDIQELAGKIADLKMNDSQRKAAIDMAAGICVMAVNTCATARVATPKSVQDKHVVGMTDGRQSKVSDLSTKEVNEFQTQLQEQRTAKYTAVSRTSEMAQGMVGSGNEIQHATGVAEQEKAQSNKELQGQFVPQLEEFINALGKQLSALNDILQVVNQALQANDR